MVHDDPSGATFFTAPGRLLPSSFLPTTLERRRTASPLSTVLKDSCVWFPFCITPPPASAPLWQQLALGAATNRPSSLSLSSWRLVYCFPRRWSLAVMRSGRGNSPSRVTRPATATMTVARMQIFEIGRSPALCCVIMKEEG
jgi:hypothetical protein